MAAAEDYRTQVTSSSPTATRPSSTASSSPAASGKTFDCISPIDGKVLTKVAECDKEDVDRAVKAARAAFDKGVWSNMAPMQRKKIMLKWVSLIEKHREELALLETLDVGKPIADSQVGRSRRPRSAACSGMPRRRTRSMTSWPRPAPTRSR